METTDFFWLHLKKCGGHSFRRSFSPPYVQTDRGAVPRKITDLPKPEWNDALNNFRVPLGEFDYKRALYAETHLYTNQEFDSMFKFAIVRNPYDRAVSSWRYLFRAFEPNPRYLMMKSSFVRFLRVLPQLWNSKYNRQIATHTAPIWPDITDESGNLLLDRLYRLEDIDSELEDLNMRLGTEVKALGRINENREQRHYRTHYCEESRALVEDLYSEDLNHLSYEF